MVIAEVIENEVFKNAINLSKYEKELQDKVVNPLIRGAWSEVKKKMKAFDSLTDFQQQRLAAQNDFLSQTFYSQFTTAENSLKEELVDFSALQAQQAINEINTAVRIPLLSVTSSPKFFATLVDKTLIEGLPLFTQPNKNDIPSYWTKLGEDTQRQVAQEIRKGLLLGETPRELRSRIIGKKDKQGNFQGGVLNTTRRNAEAITRTAVHEVTNEARSRMYEENLDVIEGVQSIATLDGRTTLLCRSYDGLKWVLPDYKPKGHDKRYIRPPRHFRCRSVLVPVIAGIEEIDKKVEEMGLKLEPTIRASNSGPVAASKLNDTGRDMEKWFKNQSVEAQNKMLGVGKAEIWRQGKASLYQMVNQDGEVLTLAQIRQQIETNSLTPLPKTYKSAKKKAEKAQESAQTKPLERQTATQKKAERSAIREAQALPSTAPVVASGAGSKDPFKNKSTIDGSGWTQKSGRLGSNEGGIFEDAQGNQYYAKFMSPERIDGEIGSSLIYEALGLRTLQPTRVNIGGRLAIATRYRTDLEDFKGDPKGLLKKARANKEQFMAMQHASVLNKNWDFVGEDFDNLKFDKKTKEFVMVDSGGSFQFRAQGAKKSWYKNEAISEYITFRDINKNPQTKKIIDGILEKNVWDETLGIERIFRTDPAKFKDALRLSGMPSNEADEVWAILSSRRNQVIERYGLGSDFNTSLISGGLNYDDALKKHEPYTWAASQVVDPKQIKKKSVSPSGSVEIQHTWSGDKSSRSGKTGNELTKKESEYVEELKAINAKLPVALQFKEIEIGRVHEVFRSYILNAISGSSSSLGGAILKSYGERVLGGRVGYHRGVRDLEEKMSSDIEKWFNHSGTMFFKGKNKTYELDKMLGLHRGYDQARLRKIHGFNYVNVERGHDQDELAANWSKAEKTWHSNGSASTSISRLKFKGPNRVSIKAGVQDFLFSFHWGQEYFTFFDDNEDEYVLNGKKYKAHILERLPLGEDRTRFNAGFEKAKDWNFEEIE